MQLLLLDVLRSRSGLELRSIFKTAYQKAQNAVAFVDERSLSQGAFCVKKELYYHQIFEV